MEQALSMNLTQHLAMTTQLQQAIHILQLSAQDLRTEVEKAYLENPALEMDEPVHTADSSVLRADNLPAFSRYLDGGGTYEQGVYSGEAEAGQEPAAAASLSLEDELLAQARLAFTAQPELAAAMFIIGSLDSRGYLAVPLPELAQAAHIALPMMQRVLQRVQTFEPAGVAATGLQECLRLQAERQGAYKGLVAAVLDRHLPDIAAGDLKAIAHAEHTTLKAVQRAVDFVRQLDPKPGRAYGGEPEVLLEPDVIVRRVDGEYRITLQDNGVPQLHIAAAYRQADQYDAATQKYINGRLRAAEWLIRSIAQRRETIKKIVTEIVRRQRDFIEQGTGHLHAMTMQDVAAAIGVHESTVSRAVANKYVALPNGLWPLRKFFTSNLAKQAGGGDFIAPQVKEAIEQLIQAEDKHHPLSDQKLCTMLADKGMALSRRTVMKYREQLGFPSSTKRKRY